MPEAAPVAQTVTTPPPAAVSADPPRVANPGGARESEQALDAAAMALIKMRPEDPADAPAAETKVETPAAATETKVNAAVETPAPMDPARVVELARQKLAERRRVPTAKVPDSNAQIAEALKLLSERLGQPQTKVETKEQGVEVSLRRLSRETGLRPTEVYKLLTEELTSGRAATLPAAPASPESVRVAELETKLTKAAQDLEDFKTQIYAAADESKKQREAQEQAASQTEFNQRLRAEWTPWVDQSTEKYPYVARMAKSNKDFVLNTLAQGTLSSVDKLGRPLPGLTPDRLLANFNEQLKTTYLQLGGTEQTATAQPSAAQTQPAGISKPSATPQSTAQPTKKAPFVIPDKFKGMRFRDDEDARLTIEAMSILKERPKDD